MHIMITKHKSKHTGKVSQHAKIVESYRDAGKTPRKRTIFNLGPVKSKGDMEKYRNILSSMQTGNSFVNLKDISANSAKEFGMTFVASNLLDEYGISNILKDN
ncbi:MAG: hypothetical protein QME12_06645, partial [Nanoarchaeota archaeon]|nr:hypothetical protein [Nanoarchaeota archaeon]